MSIAHQLYLQIIRETEAQDTIRFDAFRAAALEKLLDHVWRQAPAQRKRLAPIVRDGTLDMTRWHEIPVLRPADVMRESRTLVARQGLHPVEVPPSNAFLPLPIVSTPARMAAECELERCYELCEMDPGGRLGVLDPTWSGGVTGGGWSITIPDSPWLAGPVNGTAAEQFSFVSDSKLAYLRTTTEIARRLASGPKTAKLSALLLADDNLADEERDTLGIAFDCPIIHLVARPIVGVCAMSPDRGAAYRLPATSNLVEVVAIDGNPTPPGEEGELVMTPLYETAFPLIRLATGIGATAPQASGTLFGVRSADRIFAV